ncbi:MAG: SagB family peptide dehydrogenase [Thermodesulfobacteriota bacterium]
MRFRDFAAFHEAVSFPQALLGPGMDRTDRPDLFKSYPEAETIVLDWSPPEPRPLDEVLAGRCAPDPQLSLGGLAQVLLCAYGLTRREAGLGWEHWYRTVASAGALYPAELYVAAIGLPGLGDGLHHLDTSRPALSRLRSGDCTAELARAAGLEPGGLWFVLTGVFHRSAWKYGPRAFRYVLLDVGHLLESLCQSLAARGLAPRTALRFDQAALDELLGLDPEREACLAAVRAEAPGPAGGGGAGGAGLPGDRLRRSSRTARRDGPWEEIVSVCRATAAGREPRGGIGPADLGLAPGSRRPVSRQALPRETLEYPAAVLRRRSRRDFASEPLEPARLNALLSLLGPGTGSAPQPVVPLLLTQRAGDLADGLHILDLDLPATALVRPGQFFRDMAAACLDQAWMGRANLCLALVTDFPALEREWGQAGYRAAHLAAGRLGQRFYVAATALGLGCCGVGAFLDHSVRKLLGLPPGGRLLFVLAAGRVKE